MRTVNIKILGERKHGTSVFAEEIGHPKADQPLVNMVGLYDLFNNTSKSVIRRVTHQYGNINHGNRIVRTMGGFHDMRFYSKEDLVELNKVFKMPMARIKEYLSLAEQAFTSEIMNG